MRIIDDEICHIKAATCGINTHTHRERIKHAQERRAEKPKPTESEKKELETFFMMGFDSATLALLVNKSYRKKSEKGKTDVFRLCSSKAQNHFWSLEFCQVTCLQEV